MPNTIQSVTGSIDAELREIFDMMSTEFGSAVQLGQNIGLLGAVCYIFYRIWRAWSSASTIHSFELFKPIVYALILMCYVPLVDGFRTLGDRIEQGTYQGVLDNQKKKDELNKLVEQERMKAAYYAITTEKWTNPENITWDAIREKAGITGSLSYIGERMKDDMSELVMGVLEVIYAGARLFLKAGSVFFQIILFIFGPLVIGLSCFDWFSQSFPNYLGRIINVMLWAPIANFISIMLSGVEIKLLDRTLEMYKTQGGSGFVANDFSMMVFFILGTMLYFMVPVISSWMITALEGAGSNPITSAIGAAGSAVASGTGAAAGWVSGKMKGSGNDNQPGPNNI